MIINIVDSYWHFSNLEVIFLSEIYDINLAPEGFQKIAWVRKRMPALTTIRKDYEKIKPFAGLRIAMSIHLEAKTAYFASTLMAAGAEVWATGCNTLSTKNDVAAALAAEGANVFAIHGEDDKSYVKHLRDVLDSKPHLFVDDGGDLLNQLIYAVPKNLTNVIGGCEETTTGIHRIKMLERKGLLPIPMIDVNDAKSKHYYDNRYGTGQSTWTAIMKATNSLVAGKIVVVAGYGYCGRGIAMRAAGMGANVIITEIDPIKALEATMDGYRVTTMLEAAKEADIIVTATGCIDVVTGKHFRVMKDNVILANAGHFNVEINLRELAENATEHFQSVHDDIDSYVMGDGKVINVLAKGKLVNLATSAGDGHPAEIMDTSFAVQILGLRYLLETKGKLENKLYQFPETLDDYVSIIKLESLGLTIDTLSEQQKKYLGSI